MNMKEAKELLATDQNAHVIAAASGIVGVGIVSATIAAVLPATRIITIPLALASPIAALAVIVHGANKKTDGFAKPQEFDATRAHTLL